MRAALFALGLVTALGAGWLIPAALKPEDRFGVAMALLAEDRGEEAALLLSDPAWRGVAEYRAGRFRRAEAAFVTGEDARGLYNLGTARAQLYDYAGARAAFEAALRLEPAHEDAAFNLDLVEKAEAAARGAAEAARPSRRLGAAREGLRERDGEAEGAEPDEGRRIGGTRERGGGEAGEEIAADPDEEIGDARTATSAADDRVLAARGDLTEDAPAAEPRAEGAGAAEILRESKAEAEALLRLIRDDPRRVLRARLIAIHNLREAAK